MRVFLIKTLGFYYVVSHTYNMFVHLTETLYAPMKMIYCTKYEGLTAASCFVRQGSTLLYPVVSSYGYSETGYDRPSMCTQKAVSNVNSPAYYYCSKFSIGVQSSCGVVSSHLVFSLCFILHTLSCVCLNPMLQTSSTWLSASFTTLCRIRTSRMNCLNWCRLRCHRHCQVRAYCIVYNRQDNP